MKKINILIILILSLTMCGCDSSVEPNDLAYIVAVGIDMGEEEREYKYTFQIADPMKISGGANMEGGKSGNETLFSLTVTAPSIFSAVNIANHAYSKQISLSHVKLIAICSEKAQKEGVSDIAQMVARSEEIRPNTFLTVVNAKAQDYLENVKPKNEVNPVKYYEQLFGSKRSVFIPKSEAKDFYENDLSGEKANVLALSGVKKEGEEEKGETEKGFEYLMKNVKAGEAGIESEEKNQTMGMAIFKDGKMTDVGGAVDVEIYNLLTGRYVKSDINYYDKKDPQKPVTILQTQEKSPKIKVFLEERGPKIEIELFLEADLRTVSQNYIVEKELDDIQDQIKNQIKDAVTAFLEKTKTQYESDIVGFGSYAKKYFKTTDEYVAYNWQEKYKTATFDVKVDFNLRRSGLVNRKRG